MPYHLVEIPENDVADDAVRELMGEFEAACRQSDAKKCGTVFRGHQGRMRQFIFTPEASAIAVPRIKGSTFTPIEGSPDVSTLIKIAL